MVIDLYYIPSFCFALFSLESIAHGFSTSERVFKSHWTNSLTKTFIDLIRSMVYCEVHSFNQDWCERTKIYICLSFSPRLYKLHFEDHIQRIVILENNPNRASAPQTSELWASCTVLTFILLTSAVLNGKNLVWRMHFLHRCYFMLEASR